MPRNGRSTSPEYAEPAVHTLRVERIGDGSGTVTGPGIDCGAICSASFTDGTDVVLTATASAGSVLASWHGCDWTDDEDCTVSMIGARTVTAAFSTVSQDNHTLRVEKIGDGSGTVTGPGIDCGAICSASFADGTDVVLTATASADSFFAGWSDCDSTNGSRCMVTINNVKMVFAVFLTIEPGGYALIVEKTGDGSGMVSGPWIECGPCCSAGILGGTDVTLTASASDGSTFVSWDGCDWTDGASCTVTMNGARTVTATFLATWPASYALTVQKTGDGSGTVSGSGIDCGSICTASFTDGTDVTLFANASVGSTFASWSGCDSTDGTTCTVTMNDVKTVAATFLTVAPNTYTLTVQKTGSGSGTITGSGIDCGSTCSASFTDGTNVTLTAAPAGSTFASWSGCDSTSGTTCTVTMNGARTVTARFDAYICTPGATRCVAGDPGLVETCNGTSWLAGECAVRQACAERSCRYVCDLSATAPTGAWACMFPIKDGVNNNLWIQQGNGLTLGQSNNLTVSFGEYSTYRDTNRPWPAYLTITSSSSIGFNFKLNGISPGRVQEISWVGRRAGVLTANTNHYLVGVFNGTTVVANCSTQTVSYSWQSGDCTHNGTNMNYSGGWNAMLVSITGDGLGGPIDILELNWLRLSIR